MKIGSRSIPYFPAIRASLTTNQGRQLRPMGENGKGTFLSACAKSDAGAKNKSRIVSASLRSRNLAGREDGKSHEDFISDPPYFCTTAVYYDSVSTVNAPLFDRQLTQVFVVRLERFERLELSERIFLRRPLDASQKNRTSSAMIHS